MEAANENECKCWRNMFRSGKVLHLTCSYWSHISKATCLADLMKESRLN